LRTWVCKPGQSGADGLDLFLGSAGGEEFHRLRAVEFLDAQLFVEADEAPENIGVPLKSAKPIDQPPNTR
jgi:hypothetical protein